MGSPTQLVRRKSAGVAACRARLALWVFCVVSPALAAPPSPPDAFADADWARFVPGDVHFYAELRDLAGIRQRFRGLGIWQTVRDLSERGQSGATSRPWQRRTEELLGLSTEAAITELLGRRAALVASESSQWQNGLVIVELPSADALPRWLDEWSARPLGDEGPVRRYALTGGITLGVLGKTLVFGPSGDPEGLWGRTILLFAGQKGPTLAGRSDFAALRARVSEASSGTLYTTWRSGDPTAFAGCSRLLLGLCMAPSGLTCELHGQLDKPLASMPTADPAQLAAAPADSIAVWTSAFDPWRLSEGAIRGRTLEKAGIIDLLLSAYVPFAGPDRPGPAGIGPVYTIVVGRDPSAPPAGPPLPPVTLVGEVEDEADQMGRLDRVIGVYADVFAIMSTPRGEATRRMGWKREECEGAELHYVAVGGLLAERTGLDLLRRVEVCWTASQGKLYLSTSRAHVRAVLNAARGQGARLGDSKGRLAGWVDFSAGGKVSGSLFLRGDALSEVFTGWLEYLRRARPEAMRPAWWLTWATQQIERASPLGVGLVDGSSDPRHAVVREVAAESPATDLLRVGDQIVAAAGGPLTTTRPAREVMERYRARGPARTFELRVVRDGRPIGVSIPVVPARPSDLEGFDPVAALRQLAVLSRPVRSLSAIRTAGAPERFDLHVDIRWAGPP